jgi:hypothetical protein
MPHSFDLLDLLSLLLAAFAVSFMGWVFWSLTRQIQLAARHRVEPSETVWVPTGREIQENDRESMREHVFAGTEASLWTPDAVSSISRRPKTETPERRFASRIMH